MAEPIATFVARRRPGWTALEALLERQRRGALDLEALLELDHLHRRAAADLAVAQVAYGGTDVHRFLNQLCARAYGALYRPRPARWIALRRFYAHTFPAAVREALPWTRAAAGLLALGAALGALTVALHPGGVALLVPAELRAFIERRELWTDSALDFKTPGELATLIFTNNLRVAIAAFALGITGGLGTLLVTLFNGMHLGAVVTACVQQGVGPNILSFIAAHGPVELSIISIAAGAGLLVGHALIEPGEISRGAAVRARAALGVQLVLGCAPFLVAIGVVEGFVSPGSFFPWPLKVTLGAASGLAFWGWLLRGGAQAPEGSGAGRLRPER